jgi:hypothetical protein
MPKTTAQTMPSWLGPGVRLWDSPPKRLAACSDGRCGTIRILEEPPMGKFTIQPHGRLQEWIAHENGHFLLSRARTFGVIRP